MQSRVVYMMVAGLAIGMLSTVSAAMAGDRYFAVISPKAPIPTRLDTVSRTIDITTSYPVVIERTNGMSTVIEGTSLMPVLLERTTVAKPHHLPFSFGVWP